jgi:hypothetical protein
LTSVHFGPKFQPLEALTPRGVFLPAVWSRDLERFAERCDSTSEDDDGELLEALLELLERGPPEMCSPIIGTATRAGIITLADVCVEGAALVLAANCGYMISGAPRSLTIATIVPPFGGSEYSASGSTLARAVCGAIAGALAGVASQTASHDDNSLPSLRRYS